MKEKEDLENRKKLKELQDLISESMIDIKHDNNFMDEDERKKIEKVKRILEKNDIAE